MKPPNDLRCEAGCIMVWRPDPRCKNLARFKTALGRRLCSRHAGLLAIDHNILRCEIIPLNPKRPDLFPGFYDEVKSAGTNS